MHETLIRTEPFFYYCLYILIKGISEVLTEWPVSIIWIVLLTELLNTQKTFDNNLEQHLETSKTGVSWTNCFNSRLLSVSILYIQLVHLVQFSKENYDIRDGKDDIT